MQSESTTAEGLGKRDSQIQNKDSTSCKWLLHPQCTYYSSHTLQVLAAGHRAVNLRKRCSDWFKQSLGGKGKFQKDASHSHFILVLEEVLETLEWKKVEPAAQPPKIGCAAPVTNSSRNSAVFANRFANLELEDYDSDGGTVPTPATRTSSTKAPPSRTFDTDDEEDELEAKLFQVFCLFEDLDRIRTFLQQTWSDYAANSIDLMSASIVTNTALDLVREQCAEFLNSYPHMDGVTGATYISWTMSCVASGNDPHYKQRPSDAFNYGLMDVATWCLLPTYQLLDGFTRVLEPNFTPVYNGQYGWYNEKADRNRMSVREKYDDDRAFLMQHLSEFAYLADFKIPLPVNDELTRGLTQMCKTKKVPIWLAFATQVYLDIKNTLRSQPSKGFNDLRLTGARRTR